VTSCISLTKMDFFAAVAVVVAVVVVAL